MTEHRVDYWVTDNQDQFEVAAETVDCGVLVKLWQGSGSVFVMAMNPESAAKTLRKAADAIEQNAR